MLPDMTEHLIRNHEAVFSTAYSTPPSEAINLGLSTCLTGQKVRHDGGHKRDAFVMDVLGPFFSYVTVCPEVECGLPTPRESMRLVGDPASPRLVTGKTGIDHTERMHTWGKERLDDLAGRELCGYIFKSRSPSSGMARIKVYSQDGRPSPTGVGIWASMVMDRFPLLPFEDEGRLNDPLLREDFLERVFLIKRYREAMKQGPRRAGLVDFHTRHKLMFMARSPQLYREAGKLVARAKEFDPHELWARYSDILNRTFALKLTIKKHVNVLQHILGYFKKQLSKDEKQEVLELIESYGEGLLPLIVPVTLLNHFVRKYEQPYLQRQYYLNPHPVELKLRNHA